MLKIHWISAAAAVALLLSACASTKLQEQLQGTGPTTLDLYRAGSGGGVAGESIERDAAYDRVRRSINEEIRYDKYTRDAGNELHQLLSLIHI